MKKADILDQLLQLAMEDFSNFCEITNFDTERAYICMLRTKGKSYGQIAVILNKSKDQVRGIIRRNCGCVRPPEKANQ